jgi:hypothetical protein
LKSLCDTLEGFEVLAAGVESVSKNNLFPFQNNVQGGNSATIIDYVFGQFPLAFTLYSLHVDT